MEKNNNFSLLQWNVNGIRTRYDDLTHLIVKHDPTIITIQESRLLPNLAFSCKHYSTFRKDRDPPYGGGGLLTLVKTSIGAKSVDLLDYDKECLGVEFVINNKPISIINIYDNDGQGDVKLLKALINNLKGSIIITGDFNAHSAAWGSDYTSPRGERLNDCFNECNMNILNTGDPTYFCPRNRVRTHLDLSLCSADLLPHLIWKVLDEGTSDHDPILITNSNIAEIWNNEKSFWKIKKANWDLFQNIVDTREVDQTSLDSKIFTFHENLIHAAETAIGHGTTKLKKKISPPWWNNECRTAICKRNKAKNKAKKSAWIGEYTDYKKLAAIARRTILKAKTDSFNDFIATISPSTATKIVWRRAKNLSKTYNHAYPSIICDNNTTAFSDAEKAAALLEPFKKKDADIEVINNLNNMATNFPDNTHDEYNVPFTMKELEAAISTLKDGATGPDRIHNSFLRHLTNYTTTTLLDIYNECWNTGYIPDAWKSANIIPILKKNKPADKATSYRAICLTSCTLKLYEKMVSKRYVYFMESQHNIPSFQYGFRKGTGCEEALNALVTDIKCAAANDEYTVCVYMDGKGAFDNVRHEAILASLRDHNTPKNIYLFCCSYLKNRTYQMKIGNDTATMIITRGVPQGGVLSPHLFCTVMNRVPPKPSPYSTPGLYADDCKLHSSHRSLQSAADNLNLALSEMEKNAKIWDISFDPLKSKVIIFSQRRKPFVTPTIRYDNEELEIVDSHKFLGLTFDSRLSWKKHIQALLISCFGRLKLIRMISHCKWGNSQKALKILYVTLIQSKILYGITVYGDCCNPLFDKLQKMQNMALRTILGVPFSTSNDAMHILANIPMLSEKRAESFLKFTAKRISYNDVSIDEIKVQQDVIRWPAQKPAHVYGLNFANVWAQTQIFENIERSSMTEYSPPWTDSRDFNFCINWLQEKISDLPAETLKNIFYENFHPIASNKTVLFTDGSLNPSTGENGIGIFIPNENLQMQFKLPIGPCICTTELYAMQFAAEWAVENDRRDVLIISDSLSALQIIHAKNIIYMSVRQLLTIPEDFKVTFMWVPGHANIPGNEKADKLAKAALQNNNTPLTGKVPLSDAKTSFRNKLNANWALYWANSKTGRLLANFLKDPGDRKLYELNNRKLESAIFRLSVNRANTSSHKFLLNKTNSPLCSACHVIDDSEHFLTQCVKYDVPRQKLIEHLKVFKLTLTTGNLLGGSFRPMLSKIIIFRAVEEYICETIGYDHILGLNL